MLEFLSGNWLWILLIGGMMFMHLGHGGHGGGSGEAGHAGHGGCGGPRQAGDHNEISTGKAPGHHHDHQSGIRPRRDLV